MPGYLVLLAPSSNRVYAGDAPAITAAEAEIVVSAAVPDGLVEATPTTVAAVPYLSAELADGVDPRVLGSLAATFAVFAREGDLLRPVEAPSGLRLDDDLLTIPKYPGKTNEQLTRTLLNVTVASTDLGHHDRLTVLDPLAGRGTTLSWAVTLGYDAVGVEVERREVEAYAAFLTTWLRRKKLKHRIGVTTLRRSGQRLAEVLEAQVGRDDPQSLTLYAADTLQTAELLQRRRVDVVVTDAPYGVAHGSRGQSGRDRSPADLLAAALPIWVSVLRSGGALGIAWNTHGLARDDLAELCRNAGLEVRDDGPYRQFAHRVDAGIHRDLLVAVKPR
ncbi:MAG TPA: SAM-dependent methyltransferase [Lapillicoccus sp.]|nr:SAM-dependent methyltransferase [Lapillicoccus sp.]